MESLSDTKWDVVISGTGLQQSLLALALSRSGKQVLHVDDNDFYGGPEAAFSLQDVDEWVEKHQSSGQGQVFEAAEVRGRAEGLSPRAYSLALASTLIHARSKLLSQLVDSKAFRQIEFLAVGSFYIYQGASASSDSPSLSRIPSTREDVFSNTSIPVRSKRSLMKFLKFVLDFESEPQAATWTPHADEPLADFLASEFKLDNQLQSYIITLTLSLDGKISVRDGLTAISRHLTSMGVFGPGFAAVYPKWGGLSEVAQVGCRAAAVGGAVYMLGVGIKESSEIQHEQDQGDVQVTLANDIKVNSKLLVQASEAGASGGLRLSKLIAVVGSGLESIFQSFTEGSPTPAVAVVAFPAGSISTGEGAPSEHPIYAMLHSSDTGECPRGQCVVYLSTVCKSQSSAHLEQALSSLLAAVDPGTNAAESLYKLYYEQGTGGSSSLIVDGKTVTFPVPSLDLAFNDAILEPVHDAWTIVTGTQTGDEGVEYMKFEDREGANGYDDTYDYE